MLLHQDNPPDQAGRKPGEAPASAPPPPSPASDSGQWADLQPGLRKKVARQGPWFQYADAVGFEWNTYEILIHHLPAALAGLRILQIADLHAWTYWQTAYDDVIKRVRDDEPDLILLTGDMIDDKKNPAPALPIARRFMSGLKARLGIFAVRGNHDINVFPISFVGTPVKFIDGQRLLLEKGGANLELIGIPGPEREDLPEHFISSQPAKLAGVPRVIISHYPDHIRRLERLAPDLYLAGHTHGGQCCIPGGIPLLRHDSLPQELCRGVHRLAHSWFVVSRGLGFSSFPIRLFCPAEILEIRLAAAIA